MMRDATSDEKIALDMEVQGRRRGKPNIWKECKQDSMRGKGLYTNVAGDRQI